MELWDDTHIPVGDDWRRDIDDGVRQAGVARVPLGNPRRAAAAPPSGHSRRADNPRPG